MIRKHRKKKRLFSMLIMMLLVSSMMGCYKKEGEKTQLDKVPITEDRIENEPEEKIETGEIVDTGTNDAFEITIDPDDIEFSWGSDDYGEDGWVFTSTGSMKMGIPEGWEVKTALHESAMGVRSNSQNGDIIAAEIQEYSSMLKEPADKTPENQALQNNSSEIVIQDRWGNADVWYRVVEWTDYVSILAYLEYDDDHCIGFDIRAKVVNGTLEEFMESDAWNTLRTTFEVHIERQEE